MTPPAVRLRWLTAVALTLAGSWAAGAAASALAVYAEIAGSEREYTVASGDTISAVSGRFNMSVELVAAMNELSDPDRILPGRLLRVTNRRIVPAWLDEGIVINTGDLTLYWFVGGRLRGHYPIGLGRPDWMTPVGRYRIVGRRRYPTWHVPPSIQAEMRARGEPVRTAVPPGPDNPLGEHWLQLSAPGYGIHGTNAPASVGKHSTHGCIRLMPEHVALLFREVPDGTPVTIIDEPVTLAAVEGRVFIEVHRDAYGAREDVETRVQRIGAAVRAAGLDDRVDGEALARAVRRRWGVPEDVTVPAGTAGGSIPPARSRRIRTRSPGVPGAQPGGVAPSSHRRWAGSGLACVADAARAGNAATLDARRLVAHDLRAGPRAVVVDVAGDVCIVAADAVTARPGLAETARDRTRPAARRAGGAARDPQELRLAQAARLPERVAVADHAAHVLPVVSPRLGTALGHLAVAGTRLVDRNVDILGAADRRGRPHGTCGVWKPGKAQDHDDAFDVIHRETPPGAMRTHRAS